MLGGFVVLMAMGFTFQAFPRFKHSELQLAHLALAALPLLLSGVRPSSPRPLLRPAPHLPNRPTRRSSVIRTLVICALVIGTLVIGHRHIRHFP
jgi:hypothetical protein